MSQWITGLLSYCEALCKRTDWWPEAKYSLQMCFVWLELCFKQFLISYQHLTIRFHVKFNFLISKRRKMLKLWGLPWRGSICSLIDHILHPAAASTYSICLIFNDSWVAKPNSSLPGKALPVSTLQDQIYSGDKHWIPVGSSGSVFRQSWQKDPDSEEQEWFSLLKLRTLIS